MKWCVIKNGYTNEFCRESVKFDSIESPIELLKKFIFRSQNFGLITLTSADYYVISPEESIVTDGARWVQNHNACWKKWLAMHTPYSLSSIPFEQYDVVLTYEPILSQQLMSKYPQTLFAYLSTHHRYDRFDQDKKRPVEGYDVFLNHFMTSGCSQIVRLPISVDYPYLTDPETMQSLFSHPRTTIWCDAHSTLKPQWREQMNLIRKKSKLPVGDVGTWNIKNGKGKHTDKLGEVLSGHRMGCFEYMENLSKSKYFLSIWRPPAMLGQSSVEAAGMGSISFCYSDQKYVKQSHPFCVLKRKYGKREMNKQTEYATSVVIKKIQEIEKSNDLYKEIIVYQNNMLHQHFGWSQVKQLEEACQLKRSLK